MKQRDYQVGLLTGQSDRSRCALSPVQQQFLDSIAPRENQLVNNFPYSDPSPPYRRTPIVSASLSNGWAYLQSRTAAFRAQHTERMCRVLARRKRTVLITGSCGLELLNNMQLPRELADRLAVFAYGPVARRRPACAHLLVGSTRDFLSKWFFPAPDYTVDCSHIDYLANRRVAELCRNFFEHVTT